ncbi:hypothetical protein AB4Z11_29485, partial [Pseudoduganella sp. RAF53_2]
ERRYSMDDQDNEHLSLLAKLAKVVSPHVHRTVISIAMGLVGAVMPFLFKVFREDSNYSVVVLILVVAGYFVLNILTDLLTNSIVDIEISVTSATVRIMGLAISERVVAARDAALSLTYLRRFKERHSGVKLALLASATVLSILSLRFPDLDLLQFATVSIAALGLLVLKEAVVQYRIRNGLFGTTSFEARELIDFIVKNSDDIDFTDGDGNLRKALLPQEKELGNAKPHFTPGGVSI